MQTIYDDAAISDGAHRRGLHGDVLDLRPAELVRVRSASEIFATLDADGEFDSLPFMPEMLQYCGRSFRVARRADKTCAGDGLPRRMHNTVHLQNIRCDGSAHGGCQAACLMHWKEAWLERPENGVAPPQGHDVHEALVETILLPATQQARDPGSEDPQVYRCQATEIRRASSPLRVRYPSQYIRDLRNWPLSKILRGLVVTVFNRWQYYSTTHFPRRLLIAGGRKYPFVTGTLPKGTTPSSRLELHPGDLVRIKSKDEIAATLDETNHNRGLSFDSEMVKYCGRMARVLARVNRIIDEDTGKMIEINSDCIILDGVACAADYHHFCTRSIYQYWREIWLERASDPMPGKPLSPAEARRR